jgi:Uma2 family endonuclease
MPRRGRRLGTRTRVVGCTVRCTARSTVVVAARGGWRLLFEPELHLANDIVVPDVAGWRRERLPSLPEQAYFTLRPDWVCEVVSPSTASMDRVKKLAIYARERVDHAWLVDPIARTLEVLRLNDGHWTIVATAADAEVLRVEPFEAIELDLSLLWEMPAAGA